MDQSQLEHIAQMIHSSQYLVVFTGAGVSTASGLPDYRGPNGIWTLRDKGIEPQLPKKAWYLHEPNAAHLALVELQNMGILKFLISQNVDGLHLKSGIDQSKIAELHGNATKLRCLDCKTIYRLDEVGWNRKIHGKGYLTEKRYPNQPQCPRCDGRLVSTIVHFGDPLPSYEVNRAKYHSTQSDVFLVLGSSLSVYPAAGLPKIAKKNNSQIVIINQGSTKNDKLADVIVDGDVSILIPKIVEIVIKIRS